MSDFSVDAKPIKLELLLNAVEQGTAVLPSFQRDFDWSNSDVISLLATILSEWPAGSLLLMEGKPEFFEVRGFDDGPDVSGKIRFVVLDGQQRLTALFHSLRGRGDVVFVLNAKHLAQTDGGAEDIEEAISVVPQSKWRADFPIERQIRDGLVPLREVRTASDFFSWRDKMVDAASEADRQGVAALLSDVYRTHLSNLNSYTFPAVLLDSGLPPSAVARIFERINLTGLRLNTFDLLVARVYAPDWNLRDRWETARRESEPIAHWLGEDGLPLIQAISLHLEGDVRQPALLALKAREIRENWDASVVASEQAILKLRSIGVPTSDWMPYKGLLLPLVNRVLVLGDEALDDNGALATWFWARSFGMDYGVGSSTRLASDAKLLSEREPNWRSVDFAIDSQVLFGSTRRQQKALWAAFVSLIASRKARDLLTGEVIEDPAKDAVVVSLFGRGGSDLHLRVLGLVLVTRSSARVLRKDRGEFIRMINPAAAESQLLPRDALAAQLLDPDIFFRRRLEALKGAVDEVSTVPVRWFDGREAQ